MTRAELQLYRSQKGETFCQRIVKAANIRPDKVAMMLIEPEGNKAITFGSMLAQIRSIAYRLTQEKIALGDRVALIGENHPNWAIAYLGILYRGSVVTPLDPAATTQAVANFLKGSEAKLAFVSPASLDKFRAACERIGSHIPAVALHQLTQANGLARFEDWAETPVPREFSEAPPPARGEDLAVLMYTSGTTGVPKAVPLTHGNIYAESDKVQEVMRIGDQEVILSLLPLFHAYSQIVNLWLATIVGSRVVYLTELSSAGIERGLRDSGATALVGVPRLWYLFHKKIFDAVLGRPALMRILFRILLALNGFMREWLGINAGRFFFKPIHRAFGGKLRLAVSGGASFDENVARDFHRLGFTILQGYGLTETSGAATVTRFEDNKIGSVGTPLNGVDVKIDQPNDEGIGEVLIRGPVVMSGYYQNPEANREAFTSDGWFRSGDLGRLDKQGHLYIVGRKKDVIKLPSGKNIFPEDVEAHYERSPFVSEICVLGVKDETSEFKRAEKLCAVVVPNFDYLKAQHIGNAREWVVWELQNLGRELPEYQRVHDFLLRAEPLPRTTTRKIKRFELGSELDALRAQAGNGRASKATILSQTDQALMESPAGRATVAAVKQLVRDAKEIHPQMNLEIDLGLDSLARAECIVSVEQSLGIELKPEDVSNTQTVGELVQLANAKISGEPPSMRSAAAPFHWRDVLATAKEVPEVDQLLRPKPAVVLLARVALKVIYFAARLLFRMEVKGREVLTNLEPPYLICPNHQSYLDPFLVCSTYPRRVLTNIFHVGASMYFTNAAMAQLARLINVVPIDPDLQMLHAMRAGVVGLRAGKILNIYPEGQRSLDGKLHEFKKGAAILATELKLPIVPVALDGTYRIWPRKSWRLRLAKVRITFGEPIDVRRLASDEPDEDAVYQKVTSELKRRIQHILYEVAKVSG
ncbi:MAG TPA: AMP-binding protein [Pyrinomonadaceae bacterium]|nr:AMP-binding protein [Pyrinomonadaceae bacterium]